MSAILQPALRCVALVVAGNECRRLYSEMEPLSSVVATIADHEGPDSDRAQGSLQRSCRSWAASCSSLRRTLQLFVRMYA
jgi:hypothetical protein